MVVPTRTRALLATPRKASTSSPLRARIARPPTKRRRLQDEGVNLHGTFDVLNAKAGEQALNGNSRRGRKAKSSPRKRKRVLSAEEESDTGSWIPYGSASASDTSEDVNVDGDEEMQFIDEDDRHLLREASSAHLQRLRKNELARLWRVAGLDNADTSDGDENDELRKTELIQGIINARRPPTPTSTRFISPLPKKTDRYRSRDISPSSSYQISNASSHSSASQSASSQSSNSAPTRNGSRRSLRRASTLSSSAPLSDRPRRKSQPVFPRGTTPSRRAAAAAAVADDVEMGDNEPTPIQKRLRPRARAPGSEADAEDDDLDASPVRRTERALPGRRAKRAAIEALKGGESTDESETMMEANSSETEKPQPPRRKSRNSKVLISPPATDEDEDGDGENEDSRETTPEEEALADQGRNHDHDEDESVDGDFDIDLTEATKTSLYRLLRHQLVSLCESRGLEVGGTKAQLAQALLDWREEHAVEETNSSPSSTGTARPVTAKPGKIIHAINHGNFTTKAKPTPVLMRDHIHASDPATPPLSDEPRSASRNEGLDLDLSGLGLEDSMIDQSQLIKLEKIGSGGFKDVFVGKLKGRKVAISEFRGHLSEMDIRELKLLSDFAHENIVRFRGVCIPSDSSQVPCMLVSELCENGDLFDYIRNVPRPSNRRVLNLMLDIAKGLEYLHTRKPAVIHRDCKSSNILINKNGKAKVGDFGLARVKHSTRSMIRSLVGTVNWQAPELWHANPRYDYKVDVFSCGMVYWEMLSGWTGEKKYPWEGHNEHYIYDAVGSKHKRPSIANLRKQWGAEPVNLVERMWAQDPAQRPTMTDVVHDLEALIADL